MSYPLPDLLCTHKLGTSPKTYQSTAQQKIAGRQLLVLKLSMEKSLWAVRLCLRLGRRIARWDRDSM